jgi:hypothetical protein
MYRNRHRRAATVAGAVLVLVWMLLALYPDAGRNADEVVVAHPAERPARAGNRRVRAT